MLPKLSDFFEPKLFYRYLTIWLLLGGTFYLIAAKDVAVKEVAFEIFGFKALLGDGPGDRWKPILSKIILDADTPWLSEVGLFLQVNNKRNVDGRFARNLGEICFAVRYSTQDVLPKGTSPDGNYCAPEDFAKTRLAIDTLNDIGFLQTSRYVNAAYPSYELNALGTKAFEGVRETWLEKGDVKAIRLALMDVEYPGLRTQLVAARDWYGEQMSFAQ